MEQDLLSGKKRINFGAQQNGDNVLVLGGERVKKATISVNQAMKLDADEEVLCNIFLSTLYLVLLSKVELNSQRQQHFLNRNFPRLICSKT